MNARPIRWFIATNSFHPQAQRRRRKRLIAGYIRNLARAPHPRAPQLPPTPISLPIYSREARRFAWPNLASLGAHLGHLPLKKNNIGCTFLLRSVWSFSFSPLRLVPVTNRFLSGYSAIPQPVRRRGRESRCIRRRFSLRFVAPGAAAEDQAAAGAAAAGEAGGRGRRHCKTPPQVHVHAGSPSPARATADDVHAAAMGRQLRRRRPRRLQREGRALPPRPQPPRLREATARDGSDRRTCKPYARCGRELHRVTFSRCYVVGVRRQRQPHRRLWVCPRSARVCPC